MISPIKKNAYSNIKLLPTIHLFDQITLRSWAFLRKMSIDFGKKYVFRQEILLPFLIIQATISITFFIFFKFVIKVSNPDQAFEIKKFENVLLFIFCIYFIGYSTLLHTAANVNSHFVVHNTILKDNKEIYQDILDYKEFYFKDSLKPDLTPLSLNDLNVAEKIKKKKVDLEVDVFRQSESIIHKRLVKEITLLLGNKLPHFLDRFLVDTLEVGKRSISDMVEEQRFNSFKFLGFDVTKNSVNNFILAYLSILGTSIEFFNGL